MPKVGTHLDETGADLSTLGLLFNALVIRVCVDLAFGTQQATGTRRIKKY